MPPRARARHSRIPPAARTEAFQSIRALIDGLSRSARALERTTGITNAQLFLLQQLAESDGLSVNELAERVRTNQSTVSVVVSRLARAKLVRKARSKSDGRRIVLTLTPSAKRLLQEAPAPPTARLLVALRRLSVDDVQALARGLRVLVRALGLAPRTARLLFEPVPPHKPPTRR
jgi:DNA-binding MarR family transcriptional regulator